MAKPDLLVDLPHLEEKNKREDDHERRKVAMAELLLRRRAGHQLLHPRSVARPLLVIRTSLLALDGLKALAPTRIVVTGIRQLVVTSKEETA